jgi:hypothetical protein
MAGIYGPVTEHPEYPIEDARRFTVSILPHPFTTDDPRGVPPLDWLPAGIERGPQCRACGFRWGEDGPHGAPMA